MVNGPKCYYHIDDAIDFLGRSGREVDTRVETAEPGNYPQHPIKEDPHA